MLQVYRQLLKSPQEVCIEAGICYEVVSSITRKVLSTVCRLKRLKGTALKIFLLRKGLKKACPIFFLYWLKKNMWVRMIIWWMIFLETFQRNDVQTVKISKKKWCVSLSLSFWPSLFSKGLYLELLFDLSSFLSLTENNMQLKRTGEYWTQLFLLLHML